MPHRPLPDVTADLLIADPGGRAVPRLPGMRDATARDAMAACGGAGLQRSER